MNKVLGLDDKYDQQQYTSTFSFKLKSAAGGGVDLEASRLFKKRRHLFLIRVITGHHLPFDFLIAESIFSQREPSTKLRFNHLKLSGTINGMER